MPSWPAPSPRPMPSIWRTKLGRAAERGRTLHRALSRRRRRGAADLAGRQQSECQGHGLFSERRAAPIPRSSTTAQPAAPRSLAQVRDVLTARYDVARNDAVRARSHRATALPLRPARSASPKPPARLGSPPLRLRRRCRTEPRECRPAKTGCGGARYRRHDRRLCRRNADAGRAGGKPDLPRPVPGQRPHRRRSPPWSASSGPRRMPPPDGAAAQPSRRGDMRDLFKRSCASGYAAAYGIRQQSQRFMVNALLSRRVPRIAAAIIPCCVSER